MYLIENSANLGWLLQEIKSTPDVVSVDIEATGLYPWSDWLVAAQVGITGPEFDKRDPRPEHVTPYYIPIAMADQDRFQLSHEMLQRFWYECSQIPNARYIYHKAIFDTLFLRVTYGVNIPVWDDTLLISAILNENFGLKKLASDFFGVETTAFDELRKRKFGRAYKRHHGGEFTVAEMFKYACDDVAFTTAYYYLRKPVALRKSRAIHKMEMALQPYIQDMIYRGIPIDADRMTAPMAYLREYLIGLKSQLKEANEGQDLNPNSPKQVVGLLYDKLRLPILERTKTKAPSTNKEVLEELAEYHPIANVLREAREYGKTLSTFLEKLADSLDDQGRLHVELNPYGTTTGRFSSSGNTDHNLKKWGINAQAVSKVVYTFDDIVQYDRAVVDLATHCSNGVYDEEELKELNRDLTPEEKCGEEVSVKATCKGDVRQGFYAPPGKVWVKADLSQIEYRLQVSLAGEHELIQMFRDGHDFHVIAYSRAFRIPVTEVTKEQRNKVGKPLNFSVSYGISIPGVAKKLGVSQPMAAQILEDFATGVPHLTAYREKIQQDCVLNGFVRTFFGREREIYVPKKKGAQGRALRQAFNTHIQGTAADLMKIGMIRVIEALKEYTTDQVELVLTVHDEVDLLVAEELVDEVCMKVKRAMEIPTPPDWAPIVCDIEVGPTWSGRDLKDWETPEAYEPEAWTGWAGGLPDWVIDRTYV